MITVESMHIAPVKSLGLMHPDTVHVDRRGIAEDRRLYLIDRHSRLVTQRTLGPLVQITSQYQSEREWLNPHFPNGLDLAKAGAGGGDAHPDLGTIRPGTGTARPVEPGTVRLLWGERQAGTLR